MSEIHSDVNDVFIPILLGRKILILAIILKLR